MDNLKKHTIQGIPVIQNKQDFIIGVFPIKEILTFTKYTSRLIVGYDEEEKPIYNNNIQRFVEKSRVEKIADFLINDPDATFPTNIVLHIPKAIIEEQYEHGGFINIKIDNKVFNEIKKENGNVFITIIDGQHRIRGIEVAIERLENKLNSAIKTNQLSQSNSMKEKMEYFQLRLNDLKNIDLVVSFFIDKTLEYQAMIFSTINRTQKKVSADLVSSLFGLDTKDTPQKTALQVVLSLNGHNKSPFYKRIKLYGGNYSRNSSPPLSQATMVRSIVSLISENLREAENDRYRKRKDLRKRNSNTNKPLPFRRYYANDRDDLISDNLFYFFNAVKETFTKDNKSLWDYDSKNKPDNILQTSVGYEALLKILVDIMTLPEFSDEKLSIEFYKSYLEKSKDINFTDQQVYPFSTKGKNILYLSMSLKIWEKLGNNVKDERQKKLSELVNK